MIADIVHGETGWADVLFLVAAVIALLASWNAWPNRKMDGSLGWLSVALISVAFLLL